MFFILMAYDGSIMWIHVLHLLVGIFEVMKARLPMQTAEENSPGLETGGMIHQQSTWCNHLTLIPLPEEYMEHCYL